MHTAITPRRVIKAASTRIHRHPRGDAVTDVGGRGKPELVYAAARSRLSTQPPHRLHYLKLANQHGQGSQGRCDRDRPILDGASPARGQRPHEAVAGAASAMSVVHVTKALVARITSDRAVRRTTSRSPPHPTSTCPIRSMVLRRPRARQQPRSPTIPTASAAGAGSRREEYAQCAAASSSAASIPCICPREEHELPSS
jgi:hypothetical protein